MSVELFVSRRDFGMVNILPISHSTLGRAVNRFVVGRAKVVRRSQRPPMKRIGRIVNETAQNGLSRGPHMMRETVNLLLTRVFDIADPEKGLSGRGWHLQFDNDDLENMLSMAHTVARDYHWTYPEGDEKGVQLKDGKVTIPQCFQELHGKLLILVHYLSH